jgi:hypothetical protein
VKWTGTKIEECGKKLTVYRDPRGAEVWEDFEHDDRAIGERGRPVGPEVERVVWLGKTASKVWKGPWQTRREAQKEMSK